MGHKINPISFRLGITKNWKSRWFSKKQYRQFLEEDHLIRRAIEKNMPRAAIESIGIIRPGKEVSVTIRTARPGLIIGRGGRGLEDLQKRLKKALAAKSTIKLEIEEIRKPEKYASIVAQNIAGELERRLPFRRAMKQAADKVMQQKGVEGVKIALAGRLAGTEIARTEHLERGKVPLQTLRADIDYALTEARTTYGAIGVKVWIYRGEVFEGENRSEER